MVREALPNRAQSAPRHLRGRQTVPLFALQNAADGVKSQQPSAKKISLGQTLANRCFDQRFPNELFWF